MQPIKNLLPPKPRKSDFTINRPQTLFGENWSALKDGKCVYCGNKLAYSPSKKLYMCKSKKHLKRFVVGLEKMREFVH